MFRTEKPKNPIALIRARVSCYGGDGGNDRRRVAPNSRGMLLSENENICAELRCYGAAACTIYSSYILVFFMNATIESANNICMYTDIPNMLVVVRHKTQRTLLANGRNS